MVSRVEALGILVKALSLHFLMLQVAISLQLLSIKRHLIFLEGYLLRTHEFVIPSRHRAHEFMISIGRLINSLVSSRGLLVHLEQILIHIPPKIPLESLLGLRLFIDHSSLKRSSQFFVLMLLYVLINRFRNLINNFNSILFKLLLHRTLSLGS